MAKAECFHIVRQQPSISHQGNTQFAHNTLPSTVQYALFLTSISHLFMNYAPPADDLALLRTPPHSVEAEQSILGGLMLDNLAWDKVNDILREDDFYRYDHRLIFKTILNLVEKSHPADVLTVFESLQNQGRLDDVGGMAYLNALATGVGSAANIRRYAQIVRDRSLLRKLVSASDNISETALNPQGRDTKEIIDSAEQAILKVSAEGERGSNEFIELPIVLKDVLETINDLHEREHQGDVTGIATGFIQLDKMTSGLQKGDLVIVAGRPSMGKTSFAMNIAEHIAIEEGLPVAVFSMEMGAEQLGMRVLGSVGRINQNHLRTGKLTDQDWEHLTVAIEKTSETQLYIDESPALSAMELRARARRLHRTCGGLGLIMVDYIQLMSAPNNNENRQAQISEISRGLKSLARELDCPVVALSQLSRAVESRPSKIPMMSDIRESGAIEQDADIIMFVYREEYYLEKDSEGANQSKLEEARGKADIIIGKHRNGPTGVVKLAFHGEFTRFDNLAYADEYSDY